LVKLIEKGKKNIVYTSFQDEFGAATAIALPGISTGKNLVEFKDKACQFLRAHESHRSLQRLRRNRPLTPSDFEELGRMLEDAGGSPAVIQQPQKKAKVWTSSSVHWWD
jgi:type I restriction enzyme R subunit